jgi:hypothetical protein
MVFDHLALDHVDYILGNVGGKIGRSFQIAGDFSKSKRKGLLKFGGLIPTCPHFGSFFYSFSP